MGMEELTDFAIESIRRIGEEAISFYGKGEFHVKFDENLITEAEVHLTETFQNRLNANFPQHRIFENMSEEREYTHDQTRYLWIFDPLDGVANYQAGIPIWGISLALFDNYWPVFGVFYMPATGDIFYAKAGEKAFRGDTQIRISSQDNINNESLLLTYSRFHQHYKTTFPGKIRNLGCTAAHICYVAMGRAEAVLIGNESYEDLAAAWIIVEAAGGKIYQTDGKEFVLGNYLDGNLNPGHLLVASPETHSQIQEYLKQI